MSHLPRNFFTKYPNLDFHNYLNSQEEAKNHFDKKIYLKDLNISSHKSWSLPSPEDINSCEKWEIEKFIKMKDELNLVKNKVEVFDIEEWHKHTFNFNPALKIYYAVKYRAKPELLTQAFIKLFEILHFCPSILRGKHDNSLTSLHLCEAPGAFICSINHYISHHMPNIKWKWYGNTMNPWYEGFGWSDCVSDDRFVLQTTESWIYGEDGTGDVTNENYGPFLLKEIQRREFERTNVEQTEGLVDLVTADGSFHCQSLPGEQEMTTLPLFVSEMRVGLRTLRPGGSIVIKKFTFFESASITAIFALCTSFDSVLLIKPASSRAGNSEIYIVAMGFRPSASLFTYLDMAAKGGPVLTRAQIPDDFVAQIAEASRLFKGHQESAINRNIALFGDTSLRCTEYNKLLQMEVVQLFEWLPNLILEPSPIRLAAKSLSWDELVCADANSRRWSDNMSKNERADRLAFLVKHYSIMFQKYTKDDTLNTGGYASKLYSVGNLYKIEVMRGRRFHFVFSSRFCHSNVIKMYVQLFRESVSDSVLQSIVKRHNTGALFNLKDLSRYEAFSKEANTRLQSAIDERCLKIVMDEGSYPSPHACHQALDEVFIKLENGKVKLGADIALIYVSLLTRVQVGLLCLLAPLFERVEFLEANCIDSAPPFIVLRNLKAEMGVLSQLTGSLREGGWPGGDGENEFVLEIVSLADILKSELYPPICRYNAMYCLYHAKGLFVNNK